MKKEPVETCLLQCGVRRPAERLSILDIMVGTVPIPCLVRQRSVREYPRPPARRTALRSHA